MSRRDVAYANALSGGNVANGVARARASSQEGLMTVRFFSAAAACIRPRVRVYIIRRDMDDAH